MKKTFTIDEIKKTLSAHKVTPEPPQNGTRPASVLIPFYEQPEGLSIIFTKRTDHLESHSGQISFPGGGRDPEDRDDLETALRETHEEVGIDPAHVEIWGRMKSRQTTTSGYWVSPFIGQVPYPYDFTLSDYEVERLIIVPLAHLMDPAHFSEDHYSWSNKLFLTSQYHYGEDVIWGLTAYMLNNFLNLLKTGSELESGPGQAPRP